MKDNIHPGIKHLIFESDYWKNILDQIEESNIANKNSISLLLKDDLHAPDLSEIENLYCSFLAQDNIIAMIRNEFTELEPLTSDKKISTGRHSEIFNKIKKIRFATTKAEEQSHLLKTTFKNFLVKNVFCS